MAAKGSLYSLLGVDKSASESEIQAAYERLVIENPEGTPLHSQIVQAYTILSQIESRAQYDITGKTSLSQKRLRRSHTAGKRDRIRQTLNTLFLAGAAVTTICFVLQLSGAISTTPFYWTCGAALLIKISEYIIRLIP